MGEMRTRMGQFRQVGACSGLPRQPVVSRRWKVWEDSAPVLCLQLGAQDQSDVSALYDKLHPSLGTEPNNWLADQGQPSGNSSLTQTNIQGLDSVRSVRSVAFQHAVSELSIAPTRSGTQKQWIHGMAGQ
jgi:hypothetical protein